MASPVILAQVHKPDSASSSGKKDKSDQYLMEADECLKKNDYSKAIAVLWKALKGASKEKELSIIPKLAYWLILTSQFGAAEQVIKRGLRLSTKSSELWSKLGILYSEIGFPARAEYAFKRALELNPADPEANYYLGFKNHNYAQLQQAIIGYKEKIKAAPHSGETYDQLGQCYMAKQSFPEAFQAFKEAHKHSPYLPQIYVNLGVLYITVGKVIAGLNLGTAEEEVLNFSREMLEFAKGMLNYKEPLPVVNRKSSPAKIAEAMFLLGQKMIEEGVRRNPRYALGYHNLGMLHLSRHDFKKAEENFTEALRLNPRLAETQFNLGIVLLVTQRPQAAEKSLDKSAQLGHPNGENFFTAASIYLQSGDLEKAKKYLMVAYKLFEEANLKNDFFMLLDAAIRKWEEEGPSDAAKMLKDLKTSLTKP